MSLARFCRPKREVGRHADGQEATGGAGTLVWGAHTFSRRGAFTGYSKSGGAVAGGRGDAPAAAQHRPRGRRAPEQGNDTAPPISALTSEVRA